MSDHPGDSPEKTPPFEEPSLRAGADATILSDLESQPEAELIETGTLINNNYRITELISAGGMGEIYRAENIFTGDPVAVKVILPELAREQPVIELFMREARVLVQLRDDAIVHYHNFVFDSSLGRYCLIMEFVEGRHLGLRLKEGGPFPKAVALRLLRRLCQGLQRAHERGVIHRDLSPDNVILRNDDPDEAVLIDFGIARSAEFGDSLAGRFAGKFRYVAPEQLGHFGGQIDVRTDIYGLGLLLAALLRGRPLNMGTTAEAAAAARTGIPDLSGVSHDIYPLLQFMLEPDPANRPADLETVLHALEDPSLIPVRYRLPLWTPAGLEDPGLEGEPTDPLSDSSSPFAKTPVAPVIAEPVEGSLRARRTGWPMLGAVLILGMAVTAGGVWWTQQAPPPLPPAEDPAPPPVVGGLAPRDMQTRDGFLAAQALPPCTLATRAISGPDRGTVRVLTAAPFDPAPLIAEYAGHFGAEPSVVVSEIPSGFCPVIDFLSQIMGRGGDRPQLDLRMTRNGGIQDIAGDIRLDSGQNLWLFLVSPQGILHDLSGQVQPGPDGLQSFGIQVSAGAGDETAEMGDFLVVALASDQALTSAATAAAASEGADILPTVLDEIIRNGATAAASWALTAP